MFVYVGDDILDFIDTINLETGEVKYKGPNKVILHVSHFCPAMGLYALRYLPRDAYMQAG